MRVIPAEPRAGLKNERGSSVRLQQSWPGEGNAGQQSPSEEKGEYLISITGTRERKQGFPAF